VANREAKRGSSWVRGKKRKEARLWCKSLVRSLIHRELKSGQHATIVVPRKRCQSSEKVASICSGKRGNFDRRGGTKVGSRTPGGKFPGRQEKFQFDQGIDMAS